MAPQGMAAGGSRAAEAAAELPEATAAAPSPWPMRRARQGAARGAAAGRLAAALRRVLDLEALVEGLQADLRHAVAAGEAAALAASCAASAPASGGAAANGVGAAGGSPEPKAVAAELVQRLALVAPALEADIAGTDASAMEVGRRNVVVSHHPALPAADVRAMPQRELNRVQREARVPAAPRGQASPLPALSPPPVMSGARWWAWEAETLGRSDTILESDAVPAGPHGGAVQDVGEGGHLAPGDAGWESGGVSVESGIGDEDDLPFFDPECDVSGGACDDFEDVLECEGKVLAVGMLLRMRWRLRRKITTIFTVPLVGGMLGLVLAVSTRAELEMVIVHRGGTVKELQTDAVPDAECLAQSAALLGDDAHAGGQPVVSPARRLVVLRGHVEVATRVDVSRRLAAARCIQWHWRDWRASGACLRYTLACIAQLKAELQQSRLKKVKRGR
ncbi:unnamed protein product [Prorocentrum cordatum]|uniref:Uncharacterized protein n=1 Tax=Prorocentrum cordatum TaxID=2364126 RepID=A0ABN9PUI7_9DINO|nr:unnamed protein product [Polarella glacialis]